MREKYTEVAAHGARPTRFGTDAWSGKAAEARDPSRARALKGATVSRDRLESDPNSLDTHRLNRSRESQGPAAHELEAWERVFLDHGTRGLETRVDPEERELNPGALRVVGAERVAEEEPVARGHRLSGGAPNRRLMATATSARPATPPPVRSAKHGTDAATRR